MPENLYFNLRNFLRFLLMAAVCTSTPVVAVERIALVVGNSSYEEIKPLTNPGNDATDIGARLQALGFDLYGDGVQYDLGKRSLLQVLNRFSKAA